MITALIKYNGMLLWQELDSVSAQQAGQRKVIRTTDWQFFDKTHS
jgi:hypothetical protein